AFAGERRKGQPEGLRGGRDFWESRFSRPCAWVAGEGICCTAKTDACQKVDRSPADRLPCRHPHALRRRRQPGGKREIGHEKCSTGPWSQEDSLLRGF